MCKFVLAEERDRLPPEYATFGSASFTMHNHNNHNSQCCNGLSTIVRLIVH